MVLVPLYFDGRAGLELLTMLNWCTQNVGTEGPDTWFEVSTVRPGLYVNADKYAKFKAAGMLQCIVFNSAEDASAFKLVFGL